MQKKQRVLHGWNQSRGSGYEIVINSTRVARATQRWLCVLDWDGITLNIGVTFLYVQHFVDNTIELVLT